MLGLLKDIMLQVLLSAILIFQVPLLLDRQWKSLNRHKEKDMDFFRYRKHFVITCGVSMLLCILISSMNEFYVPLNLGIVPLFIGILYGSRRDGIVLAVTYIMLLAWIGEFSYILIPLLAVWIAYPFLPWYSAHFSKGSKMEKVGWLWSGLIPAMLIIIASRVMDGKINNYHLDPDELLAMILYVLTGIFLAGFIVYGIETTQERLIYTRYYTMQQSRDGLQKLLEMVPLGMVTVDRQGGVIASNQLFMANLKSIFPHLTSRDLAAEPLIDVLEQTHEKEYIHSKFHNALLGEETNGEIVRCGSRVYSVSVFPFRRLYQEEVTEVVGILHDMTELERMRTEFRNAERLSLVGQMAASITHEIRNPMAVVRGFLQLMKEKSPDELDHYYRIVMEELDRANGIINDFLSLAQNRDQEKEDCHLHDIIQELSPLLWADANLRGQSIELKLATAVPNMQLNPKEIKQLILNLCRNGMEAMKEKGVLTIETKRSEDDVELYIIDTGIGIPEEERGRLFEPFFTTKRKGTGLGLALCLSIVQRHNGTIAVDSEEGKGTVFKIRLPLRAYAQSVLPSSSAASAASAE
ncbi:ATP-binding protein [Paenibacillus cisolokensis]|uniref:two-component system sensor histidine kinase NtrB n=1 Tax=Paenibacillus cisolokensis TaxID=1658519 RepID=UPI003D2AEF79